MAFIAVAMADYPLGNRTSRSPVSDSIINGLSDILGLIIYLEIYIGNLRNSIVFVYEIKKQY